MKRMNLFVAVLVFAVNAFAANGLTERLQRGLFEEEANHNLDAAIQEYQVVIHQSDEQRKLIATALFRLGECHRKLGRTNEAAAYYQRVLRDFSEQETLVKLAATLVRRPAETPLSGLPEAQAKSVLVQELEKRLAALRVESIGQQMEADRIEKLTVTQFLLTEAGKNDALLPALQQQLLALNQKEAGLQSSFTPDHPERKALRDQMDRLHEQMARQREEIVQATQSRAKALQLQVSVLGKELDIELERAAARGASPATTATPAALPAGLTQAEVEELARVKSLAQNSPDLLNAPSGVTELYKAAANGRYSVVEFLLAQGLSTADRGRSASPLVAAANAGHLRIVQLLLDKGATTNDASQALVSACEAGYKSVAEALLARGAEVNRLNENAETALHHAAFKGHRPIVELLLERGANPNVLLLNPRSGRWSGYNYSQGATPLHFAAHRGDAGLAELLLKAGASAKATNQSGLTPLHVAAAQGSTNVCALLIQSGADLNATMDDGATPLTSAMLSSRIEVAALLVARGAEVNRVAARGERHAPYMLHVALGRNHPALLQALLSAKPDLEVTDWDGNTPLQYAMANDQWPLAEMLAGAGANPNRSFSEGLTLLHYAVTRGQVSLVAALLKAKADPNVVNRAGETPLSLALAAVERKPQPFLAQPVFSPTAPGAAPTFRSIPQFPGQSPASSPADTTALRQIILHLKEHGADEFLQRRGFIKAVRGTGPRLTIFSKGTNDLNRYTLLEFIAAVYEKTGEDLPWPDFDKVTIRRLDGQTEKPVLANAARILEGTNNCAADAPLHWGDEVEIPMADHPVHEQWYGVDGPAFEAIGYCLRRTVRFSVGNTNLPLTLYVPISNRRLNNYAPVYTKGRSPFFRLSATVLRDNRFRNLIRSSSDLTRVTVTRLDSETKQPRKMTFDLNAVALPDMSYSSGNQPPIPWMHDLWLRDGDVIEVPDKP